MHVPHMRQPMSTLGKTLGAVKTLEGPHLEMDCLNVPLHISEGEKAVRTNS